MDASVQSGTGVPELCSAIPRLQVFVRYTLNVETGISWGAKVARKPQAGLMASCKGSRVTLVWAVSHTGTHTPWNTVHQAEPAQVVPWRGRQEG